MLIAALVVSDSLGFGFDRAARAAHLPDIIVRFSPQPAGRVARRIAAQEGIDLAGLRGTARSGRITKADVLAAAAG